MTDKNRQLTISGVQDCDIGMYQAVLTTNDGETKDEYFAIRAEGLNRHLHTHTGTFILMY